MTMYMHPRNTGSLNQFEAMEQNIATRPPRAVYNEVKVNEQSHELPLVVPKIGNKKESVPKQKKYENEAPKLKVAATKQPNDTITHEELNRAYKHVVQDGLEKLTKFETRSILTPLTSSGDYIMPKSSDNHQQFKTLDHETINKYKTQYRSGFQVQGDTENMSGLEKLELKEIKKPFLIKPKAFQGATSYQNANGFNGHQKLKLQNQMNVNIPSLF